jgi:hypothetical protein
MTGFAGCWRTRFGDWHGWLMEVPRLREILLVSAVRGLPYR